MRSSAGVAIGWHAVALTPLSSSNRFKLGACPTMGSLGVGGSARQRSFWLCYVREAILKAILVVPFARRRAAICKLLLVDS